MVQMHFPSEDNYMANTFYYSHSSFPDFFVTTKILTKLIHYYYYYYKKIITTIIIKIDSVYLFMCLKTAEKGQLQPITKPQYKKNITKYK
jgi:hypothetical protein